MRFLLILGVCFATPAMAELSDMEKAAQGVITPLVLQQVEKPWDTAITTCILQEAKRAELRTISKADPENPAGDVIILINEILSRPDTVTCAANMIANLDGNG